MIFSGIEQILFIGLLHVVIDYFKMIAKWSQVTYVRLLFVPRTPNQQILVIYKLFYSLIRV